MEDQDIVVSAPGKVILHGEHAVVYGKPAIAGSLDLRCKLCLKQTNDACVSFDLPDIQVTRKIELGQLQTTFQDLFQEVPLDKPKPASDDIILALKNFLGIDTSDNDAKQLAMIAFLYLYLRMFMKRSELPSVYIHMKSELPVGAGLGSSAAFSVSVSAGLLQLAGGITSEKTLDGTATWSDADLDLINKWAFVGEKVIHGNPSGIDNSISTYGGAMRFQKGEITRLESMPTLSLMLVNTGVPRSTKTIVANFRQKYNTYQEIFEPVLESVEAITRKAEATLKSLKEDGNPSHYKTLEDLIEMNQYFLNLMGVGHASLDTIVKEAKVFGLSAKLTGAGGGGCAIVLLPAEGNDEKESKVGSLVKQIEEQHRSLQVWKRVSFGGKGVLRHV